MADRIQARAVRRCGELLKQMDGRGGDQSKKDGAGHFAPSRYDAGHGAGMSDRQIKTAVRVANVPEPTFEAAVESPAPPTVTKLADMGRKPRQPVPANSGAPLPRFRSYHRPMPDDDARVLAMLVDTVAGHGAP